MQNLVLKNNTDITKEIYSKGYSKNKFAIAIGITVITLNRFIKSNVATPKTAKKIADGLGMEISDIFIITE